MAKKITRDDVARLAEVSSATVSRAYNNPETVSQDKRSRIFAAAEKLEWEPNPHARNLRKRSSGAITLIEFAKEKRPYYWGEQPLLKWMYADVVRSALEETGSSPFQLRIATVHNKKELQDIAKSSEGIMVYDIDTPEEESQLEGLPCPVVISHHPLDSPLPQVCTDNRRGGRLQGEYLKERGVIRPLYLINHLDSVQSHRDRLEGFMDVYHQRDVTVVEQKPATPPPIRGNLEYPGIDGIAGVNDMTLLGRIMLPGKIPELPMVGYDNLPVLNIMGNRIASIDLRLDLIYQTAAADLITRIQSGNIGIGKTVISPRISAPPD